VDLLALLAEVGRPRPKTIGPIAPVTIGPSSQVTVAPPPRQAWDEYRWRKVVEGDRTFYIGRFSVYDQRRRGLREWNGRIVTRGREIALYIEDPPPEIKRHPHAACLQLLEGDWFHLHFATPPKKVDHALLYMQRMLDESLNQ
jgi:hypothetical protein